MKKKYFSVAIILTVAASLSLSSCIGSFQLTNKLLAWNKQIGNKFVNELVFFAFWVLPVYEVSALADILVLNSIEFWSGENPVAQGKSVIEGNDGRYIVDCDGSVVRLDFDKDEQSWSVNIDGEKHTFLTFVDDTHVALPGFDGDMHQVELSQQGVYAYRQMAESSRALAFAR